MEDNKLVISKYVDELINFAKDFARTKMPKYDSELLTIAVRPSIAQTDEISQALWGKPLFTEISHHCYCRQFIFLDGSYKERTLEEIKKNKPSELQAKKVLIFSELASPEYFRLKYEGAELGNKEITGQGWEVDIEWNGSMFVANNKTNHRTVIT